MHLCLNPSHSMICSKDRSYLHSLCCNRCFASCPLSPRQAVSCFIWCTIWTARHHTIWAYPVQESLHQKGYKCHYSFTDCFPHRLMVINLQFKTLIALFIILMLNIILGLMPFVNNFSNIGGFISGFLSGFVLLFKPQVMKIHQNKGGIFKYKHSIKRVRKFDRPISRIISLVVFSLL